MSIDHEELVQEIEAIEAIYPDLLISKLDDCSIIRMKVPQHEYVTVQISFPKEYPSVKAPNVLEVNINKNGTYDQKYILHLFQEVMDSVYHQQSVCVFDFLTELDGVLYIEDEDEDIDHQSTEEIISIDPFEGWVASEPITDRKSTFMGFCIHVNSEEEAFAKLEQLKTDPKIRKSHHVMSAWRVKQDAIAFQDSDDDGETAAGSRMLHLVTIMDVWNVMVVVVRWFGGIHLGPDRFKHINSTAREAVLKAGFKRNT
ncbi:hypothetical protein Kpol_1028p52 [Vanderwaltozyma polyspora DSM 70294]|uniref:RWD domain-containing protein n=1 Tax=Vanderwaltozyma polyspora (strain ATCC 22028 / DSM 70294 / BCRC 21397 / CBS 2163 / NBRC 10782 / NRRL Y-8283 / UCD 57-17) TaxID=436907 RepID=A7TG20_VANPO|nr:uncharacterized protein Kpol_1028p52 [Vanderwaltozyma polyspora DSM 70294]EDO18777.1 hypothetical protein Kpol_1028p52 [Vanderwaltozyma polyspora DSM 70294]